MCLRSIRKLKKTILIGVVEYYLQGIFARKMKKTMIALGAGDILASSISRITKNWMKRLKNPLKTNRTRNPLLTYRCYLF